jgi:LmbE family N-acetylglucosaminyl deacetylase
MLDLILDSRRQRTLRILCVGAHCDDIEIGCGATLRALQGRTKRLVVDWLVLSGSAERCQEARSARQMLIRTSSRGELVFGDFPDGRFPAFYAEIKDFMEAARRRLRPDLVLCHERDDRHQDHRIVNEMTWNTFRDHLVLEYEVPKWDGGLGQPNVYVPVDARQAAAKVNALLKAHRTQAGKGWFTRDLFMALLRLRGAECRSPSGYAEAFHGRKLTFRGL